MEIISEAACVVVELPTDVGQPVAAGSVIAVTELMKMRQEHRAPADSVLKAVHVALGDVIEPGTVIATLEPADAAVKPDDGNGGDSGSPSSRSVSELAEKRLAFSDEGRSETVARRHAAGGRTARENLADLADAGSFREYGQFAVAAQRSTQDAATLEKRSPGDGIITGTATVGGEPVALLAVDYTVMAGTQGYFHHQKMDRLFDLAARNALPVIMFAEGGGGRPNDTDPAELVVAGLHTTSFSAFARLSGKVPLITIVHGYCFAGNAVFPGMSDVLIATRRSWLGMGGPAMIEGGGLGSFSPEEIGPAETQFENGVIDILVEDEAEAVAAAKSVLPILKGKAAEGKTDPLPLGRIIPQDRQLAYSMREIVPRLLDPETAIELRGGYGTGIFTWLGRIDGIPVGLMASNPMQLGGAIDSPAALKASGFLALCNHHRLPIVSLIDTPGFMVGPETEKTGQVRHASAMFLAAARLEVPLFSVILRKAYGLGAMAMAGGSLHAGDFCVSWPTGEIGAMGLEGAVRLGHRAELEAIGDEAERKERYEALVAAMYEKGKALSAASKLEFDAVIEPDETRDWVLAGLRTAGVVRKS